MIPGLLAQDVALSLREFISTGYETETWPFAGKFNALVNGDGSHDSNGEAFIKGPYVSIGLPFLKNTDRTDLFSGFNTEHSPFAHQQITWDRLRTDRTPQSTLVATGTGSGKTECFLYPLLDHCQRTPQPGIKAIVIYPMNALASDQAKRFASVIHNTPELKGKVRVGLFVGGAEVTDQKTMGPEQVITCKQTMRNKPPRISCSPTTRCWIICLCGQKISRCGPISLHPGLDDEQALYSGSKSEAEQYAFLSGKLEAVVGLLKDIQSRGEKTLIFLINKKLQRLLKLWLQQIFGISVEIINGDTKAVASKKGAETRKGIITEFESKPGFGILIMSPVAAGVGLTVVGANNVIHLERHWNPAKEAQATDRVYRIGQEKDVNIYLPVLHHPERQSFDVNLDLLLSNKMDLKDAVVTPQMVSSDEMGAVLEGGL